MALRDLREFTERLPRFYPRPD